MDERVDTSDEACAVACILVSNPQGTMRTDGDGWQKRVNDLIRALRDERNDLRQRLDRFGRAPMEPDILEVLEDLHKQATTERSHHYTANAVKRAIEEITTLRRALAGAHTRVAH